MKTVIYLSIFLIFAPLFAQEESQKLSSFSISSNFSLGNSILNNQEFKNLDGSVSGFSLKAGYDFGYTSFSFLRLDLGIEMGTYNTNLFVDGNQSSLNAEYLRIPLAYYGVFKLGRNEANSLLSNTKFYGGIGAFLQYVYKYELSTIESTSKIDDVELDFGFLFNIGIEQDVSKRFSVIIGLENSFMGDKNIEEELKFKNMVFYFGIRYRFLQ